MKARPTPSSTTFPTSTLSSWARYPITEKMTNPAKMLVSTLLTDTIRESLLVNKAQIINMHIDQILNYDVKYLYKYINILIIVQVEHFIAQLTPRILFIIFKEAK